MTFLDAVLALRVRHQKLWFSTGTPNPAADVIKPLRWKNASILSPGGNCLASMLGSADEWKLEADYWKPGQPSSKAGLHYCVELTDLDFKRAVYEIRS
ncbi:hypothetical protein [Enterobacter ludwigii]|uniref:hypothetical protein n=1 Tax=Enterobacter ludwigii TaxID=299767 RepID=UPI0029017DFC|nr:hypothetical protein [Enterobacter cloacae]MDU2377083.1 hypothetical protein [Enterobacter cloacae]MDU2519738.1 hypothetical protein [Enterobacter cloacae]MDU2666133.1 hypothetical protein [Enterobacter cloacae]